MAFQRVENSTRFPFFPVIIIWLGYINRERKPEGFNSCIKGADNISYKAGEDFFSPAGEINRRARGGSASE